MRKNVLRNEEERLRQKAIDNENKGCRCFNRGTKQAERWNANNLDNEYMTSITANVLTVDATLK